MRHKIRHIIAQSKVIGLLTDIDNKLLLYFYNSKAHEYFLKINRFFKNSILKGKDESFIINSTKKIVHFLKLKDVGWFVILVVLFNTVAMLMLEKKIDIFSFFARMFFLTAGLTLIIKGKNAKS